LKRYWALEFIKGKMCVSRGSANMNTRRKPPTLEEIEEAITLEEIEQAILSLEREGRIEKKRDELGNVVTRLGEDGKRYVVWVATNLTPLRKN
jgi:hypothetical protein